MTKIRPSIRFMGLNEIFNYSYVKILLDLDLISDLKL